MSDHQDQKRYENLKRSIADVGLIRQGSLVRRFMPCGKPGCRCQASPPELHGPYYQWTRKIRGKTVTVRLTKQEATLLDEWIQNGRQLDKIITQMRALAHRITSRMLKQMTKTTTNP
jgi:hypothetical protein